MRISDWSSDVCSSDLLTHGIAQGKYLRNLFGGFWPHNRVGINSGHEETRLATADILTGQYAVGPDNGAYLFDQRRINGIGHCSEERRVGKDSVSTCRSRRSPDT